MSDTIRALSIPVAGEIEAVELEIGETSYAESIAEAVGGYFEVVDLAGVADMWVNEEGLLMGLPFNVIASVLASTVRHADTSIVGNVVITGPTDRDGNCTPFTPELERKVRALFRRSLA